MLQPPNFVNLERRLRAHGFTRLGEGYFSSVWAKEGSDRVIKLCKTPDRSLDFYLWATRNGYAGNICPQVYSIRQYGNGSYIAVIERLSKTVCAVRTEHIGRCERWSLEENWQALSYLTSSWRDDFEKQAKVVEMVWPGVPAFMQRLRAVFGTLDSHDQNWMLRADGSLVCTDPVAHGKSDWRTNRLRSRDLQIMNPEPLPLAMAA